MNKHVIQFSLSLAAMLNFNIHIGNGLLDDARRKIIFFFLFCFRWLTIKPRGCMSFPYCGLSQWRFSLIQGVSPPSDAMGLQWWWTHVLWNAKQQYWVLAVQNAGWMSNASRNAKRTSTSALKSVVQKSRRRKNKIEVTFVGMVTILVPRVKTKDQEVWSSLYHSLICFSMSRYSNGN